MSYTHTGKAPVSITRQPMDADSTDWVYFVYEDWLRLDEVITASAATVVGGELVTDSVYIGTMTDEDGADHTNVYGVQVKPAADSYEVTITHRVSTETLGAVDLGRLDIDRTVTIAVEVL
jgi:hypothetical protein